MPRLHPARALAAIALAMLLAAGGPLMAQSPAPPAPAAPQAAPPLPAPTAPPPSTASPDVLTESAPNAFIDFLARDPDCREATNLCQVCKLGPDGPARCSTPGIACQPAHWRCAPKT